MRRVTIIGSGRTGRGMLGELFYSEKNFDLVFADIDSKLVDTLREQKNLLTGTIRKTRVDNFHAVDVKRDHAAYIDFLAESEIVATAVFPESFDAVAADLAEMVSLRNNRHIVAPVAVILGGNYVGLKPRFDTAMTALLSEPEKDHYNKYVTLITSKANRKVVYPDVLQEDALALTGDDKPVLQVDNAFRFGPDWNMPSFFEPIDSCELGMIKKSGTRICFTAPSALWEPMQDARRLTRSLRISEHGSWQSTHGLKEGALWNLNMACPCHPIRRFARHSRNSPAHSFPIRSAVLFVNQ